MARARATGRPPILAALVEKIHHRDAAKKFSLAPRPAQFVLATTTSHISAPTKGRAIAFGETVAFLSSVIPAQAGIQRPKTRHSPLDSRLRGNDGNRGGRRTQMRLPCHKGAGEDPWGMTNKTGASDVLVLSVPSVAESSLLLPALPRQRPFDFGAGALDFAIEHHLLRAAHFAGPAEIDALGQAHLGAAAA